jgi:hypothetical protein
MNEEKINELIASIKNEKLREYLCKCFKLECQLNSNLPLFLIKEAKQRFENKIKACEQIVNDLPDRLISDRDPLLKNLDTLRFMLAMVYINSSGEIIEHNYKEMKFFISKVLNLKSYQLKLNYFYLAIKLLEKIETGKEESHCNKEFIGALDLLQKFVTEEKYIPNEANLKYISDLDHGSNESDIRKSFYGIIHELDNKLLFQDLLKQLLKIIKNKNDSPLILFSSIFIEMCLVDAQMEAEDLHQALRIMHSAFKDYNEQINKKFNSFSLNRLIRNDLIDLNQFEKDKQEKISRSITDNLANKSSQKQESVQVALILKEFDFGTFFTTDVNSKKIKSKLDEAKVNYNDTFKREASADNFSSKFFKEGWKKISSTANQIIEKGKAITADTVVNLEEFAENNANRLTTLIKKNRATSFSLEQEEIYGLDLNNSLTEAKEKLALVKVKLSIWNSILNFPVEPHINQHNHDTGQIKITENIAAFETSINKKYTSLKLQISKILNEFERNNNEIKTKNYWFAKSENSKPSLAHKIFHRGYFNIDFSAKKIKAELGNAPSFDKINNLILKQSFWSLLFTYRIVRWPWMNKTIFAHTWAEQLCLPDVITQTEELKSKLFNNSNEDLVEEIIVLLNAFPSYKKSQTVVEILNELKNYIVAQLIRLESFELEISNCLKENINRPIASHSLRKTSFYTASASNFSATDSSRHSVPMPISVN